LGAGGHWFPGENADGFETQVSEQELRVALAASPWVEQIPDLLRSLRQRLGGEQQQRLSAGG